MAGEREREQKNREGLVGLYKKALPEVELGFSCGNTPVLATMILCGVWL